METALDVSGVQRIVLRGLGLSCVRHYFLGVTQPQKAREFLKSIVPHLPSAGQQRSHRAVTVALTYPGLQALRLQYQYLSAFRRLAPAFAEGAAARAAAHLGDTGRNESPGWQQPFLSPQTHVVLSIYADEDSGWTKRIAALHGGDPLTSGLSGWDTWIAGKQLGVGNDRREPFGFRDGISQPTVKRVHLHWAQRNPASMHVEPGEFLLGHANEDGSNRWRAEDVPQSVRDFVRDGSFMALRKMSQDTAAFAQLAADVQAKMCGRWPNGALVREGERTQPVEAPGDAELNRFDFAHDPHGHGCPFASHIRRLNPRSDVVIPPRKRVLMRRGMPYEEAAEVGLLGLFVCADLECQFEFLLSDWTREAPMLPREIAPDPLIAARDAPSQFRIPSAAGDRSVQLLNAYVTTRGTLYGFIPSLRALATIDSAAA